MSISTGKNVSSKMEKLEDKNTRKNNRKLVGKCNLIFKAKQDRGYKTLANVIE